MRKTIMIISACLALGSTAQAAEVKTVLAAGCFWSMQKALDHAPGVTATVVGYAGGSEENPTYKNYHDGDKPHIEAVEITYDNTKTTYTQLLDYFFHHMDPTSGKGQFCDFGPGYRPAVFVANDAERDIAKASIKAIEATLGKDVEVPIRDAARFYPAEDYHQKYYLKNPAHYDSYNVRCGRDAKLKVVWGDKAGH